MEVEALEIFLDVVRLGNFSRAARSRDLAVSSVTRRIDQLEQDIGTPLFSRSSRSVELTDAGKQLVGAAHNVIGELADARAAIWSMHSEPQGTLTVTVPASFGRRHVAPAVATFLLAHPALEIELLVTDEIVDLSSQRVDVAVRIGRLDDKNLLATTLAPQRRVAVASPAYLARAGRPETPAGVLDHNCLTHGGLGKREGWWQFSGVNGGRPLPVKGSLRTDDSESILRAVLAGVGIGHLATWLVQEDIAAGRLVALFDGELREPRVSSSGIHAVRMPGRSVRKASLFIDHLRREFGIAGGGLPHWDRALPRRRGG